MPHTDAIVVLTTVASDEEAVKFVRALLDRRLIACGTLVPGARSIYRWKDGVQDEREVVVLLKTRKQDWAVLMSRLSEMHPYKTPECVAVRIAAGAPAYMEWLESALAPEGA